MYVDGIRDLIQEESLCELKIHKRDYENYMQFKETIDYKLKETILKKSTKSYKEHEFLKP